jgi:hypothetical protein
MEEELSSFNARLRLPGRTRLPLGVEVDIHHERLTLTTGDRTVANWPLEKLEVTLLPDGFHIEVDGEEMVLNVADASRFAAALGVATPMAGRPTPASLPVVVREPDAEQLEDLRRRISDLARDLTSETVTPSEVFAQWLRLLKELNRLHGDGALPNPLCHQLTTHLLELIPEPSPTVV